MHLQVVLCAIIHKLTFMNNYLITYDGNMSNNYTKMLLNGVVSNDENVSIKDIPVFISMVDTTYPLAFIDYETDDTLGVNYTAEDGTERFVVINKKYVIDVAIMYEQDIDIMPNTENEKKEDIMYQ